VRAIERLWKFWLRLKRLDIDRDATQKPDQTGRAIVGTKKDRKP
jgi:hypothetical protein